MKYLFRDYLVLAGFAGLIYSCNQEEIIEVDLSVVPAQYVIEGSVTDENVPYSVRITRTVDFYHPNDFPAVGGATVIIGDNSGRIDTLFEKQPGIYETSNALTGVSGRTYTLQVWVEGHNFTALSTMPNLVPFEDLNAIRLPFVDSSIIVMTPIFIDPVGLGNNYQFVQSNNGKRQPFIFVIDDRNNDGTQISSLLFAPDLETKIGDSISIEMRNIDRATYKYFVALDASNGNGPNAGVPANPDNNFGGACLGYFAAYTVQRRSLIVE